MPFIFPWRAFGSAARFVWTTRTQALFLFTLRLFRLVYRDHFTFKVRIDTAELISAMFISIFYSWDLFFVSLPLLSAFSGFNRTFLHDSTWYPLLCIDYISLKGSLTYKFLCDLNPLSSNRVLFACGIYRRPRTFPGPLPPSGGAGLRSLPAAVTAQRTAAAPYAALSDQVSDKHNLFYLYSFPVTRPSCE